MPSISSRRRPLVRVATAALAVAAAGSTLIAANPAGAIQIQTGFGGSAYGSAGHLGTVLQSGRSALVPMCTGKAGTTHTDQTQQSSDPRVGSIGSVHTSVASKSFGNTIESVSTSHTSATALFGKVITGDAFGVTAKAARVGADYKLSATTTLTDVRIMGHAAPTHPAVNQTIALPGIGSIVLNKQARGRSLGAERISVIAMQISVSGNNTLGLPSGSLIISAARASLHAPAHHLASGNAYGSTIVSGSQVRSGKTAPVTMPCGGTSGATRNNVTAALNTPGLKSAATHTRARSVESATGTTAILTSTIAGVNLLGGIVRASTITSRALVTRGNGHLTRSSAGTSIGDLTINGKKQSADQPANTKWTIPGVGTLWAHRVIKTPAGVQVFALQLVLAKDQAGLTKGTVLTIGGTFARVGK